MSDNEEEKTSLSAFSIRAGAISTGVHLPDPSNDNKIVIRPWTKSAPKWRHVDSGLNLEAHCQNSSCQAYKGGYVLVRWGYRNGGVFDFFRNERDCGCPICGKYVQIENFGFCDTYYKVIGYKKEKIDGPYKDIDTDWKFAPDTHYTTFANKEEDLVFWGKLEIRVKRR